MWRSIRRRAYEIAPRSYSASIREIRAAGLELLGIYHSHPNGDNQPSPRDVERAYYPDAAYFILSPRCERSRTNSSLLDSRWPLDSELTIQIV